MAYVNTVPAKSPYKIKEGDFQKGFKDMLIQNGWTSPLEFKKVSISTHYVTNHPETGDHTEYVAIANHQIYRNAKGDLLGLATTSDWTEKTDHNVIPFYNWFDSTEADKDELVSYLEGKFEENKNNSKLYFYMLEKLPSNIVDGDVLFVPWGSESAEEEKEILRMVLDAEVKSVDFNQDGSNYNVIVSEADRQVMQSPIVKCDIRSDVLKDSEWLSDSMVSVQGQVDSNNLFVIMQADNAMAWEDNLVPSVPFYFGGIDPTDEGDEAVAMFAGTVPEGATEAEVAEFDFDTLSEVGERINPILKPYPEQMSNGVDSVMVNKTKLGTRYQKYYLSWGTAPNEMPPERSNDDGTRDYPRSYNSMRNFQFNPSRYSGKVQSSYVYLIHPEEGVRGRLLDCVGLSSQNINNSELRIRKEDCPDKVYDVYQCHPVSGISPLTKRPSTAYRPMGLGVFKEVLDTGAEEKDYSSDTEPPSNVSNLDIEVEEDVAVITWENPTEEDFDHVVIEVDGEVFAEGVREVETYTIPNVTTGTVISLYTVDKVGNVNGTTEEVTV